MEPADVRARNVIAADAMPYDTGLLYRDGNPQVYDSGNFPELLRRARALIGLEAIRERQKGAPGGESAASRRRVRDVRRRFGNGPVRRRASSVCCLPDGWR